jgi:ribosomal protein L15E
MRKTDTQKLKTVGMQFLRSVTRCTRLDKIRKEGIRKEPGVFSINERIRRHRKDWLEHMERMEEG